MKLYATTTSDRASKGQGGNKQLSTEFYVGDKRQPELAGVVTLKVIGPDIFEIMIDFQCLPATFKCQLNEWGNIVSDLERL